MGKVGFLLFVSLIFLPTEFSVAVISMHGVFPPNTCEELLSGLSDQRSFVLPFVFDREEKSFLDRTRSLIAKKYIAVRV